MYRPLGYDEKHYPTGFTEMYYRLSIFLLKLYMRDESKEYVRGMVLERDGDETWRGQLLACIPISVADKEEKKCRRVSYCSNSAGLRATLKKCKETGDVIVLSVDWNKRANFNLIANTSIYNLRHIHPVIGTKGIGVITRCVELFNWFNMEGE